LSRRVLQQSDLPDNPRRIFWLLVLYRWLSLAPPLLALLVQGQVAIAAGAALALAAAANLVVTLFAGQLNRFLEAHVTFLGADLLLVALLVALTGGAASPYYFYALSPLLAAAFFFQWRGALLATAVLAPLYLGAVLLGAEAGAVDWLSLGGNLTGFFLIAGAFGYAGTLLAQVRATSRDLAVLQEVTASLHNAADVNHVQEMVLEVITAELGFRRAVIGLVDETGTAISGWLARLRGGETGEMETLSHAARLPLTAEGGLAATALVEGRVCRASPEEPCTADGWLNNRFGMNNCLIIPLQWGIQPIGILLVDTAGQGASEMRVHSLEAIAQQTAVAIGMMRTRTRRARESAVQAERGRIALDMHDAVSQSLFGIVFTLDGALKLLESEPETARAELEEALQTAERARQEIRQTIHELWSEEMSAASFERELRQYTADVLQAPQLAVTFDIRGAFDDLSAPARRSLYRMAQEGLSNVVHHAAAGEAQVCLDVEGGRARLAVRDDGRGFEPEVALTQVYGAEHFGLRGMQARARALGGTCDIFSQPGAGTSVVVDIPANARLEAERSG
jgi:signal transduction histidine kinase